MTSNLQVQSLQVFEEISFYFGEDFRSDEHIFELGGSTTRVLVLLRDVAQKRHTDSFAGVTFSHMFILVPPRSS